MKGSLIGRNIIGVIGRNIGVIGALIEGEGESGALRPTKTYF